ncbi:MAG: DNA-3-methyladenine glycosylase 2 [Burkholderiales bacterium]|nr:MAG: DNA-3-methyladenine glycosylase 2 [Burkholderiales bacterium]
MLPGDDYLYRALSAHDERFDGRFFVGVRTTGIYCRPVCRVRLPRRANCSFFASAAAAERRGFRPCLRCRPELAPGTASVDASARLARSAAAAIEEGALEGAGLAGLAARLGVSDRHLRRVFVEAFGVAPIDYAQTQRLLLAKRLLTDTAMPILDVAFAAGFGSLRRLNAAFRERYRMSPGALRRAAGGTALGEITVALAYRPPYDWAAMLGFLGRRAIAGVESVDQRSYRRTVVLDASDGRAASGWLQVTHDARRGRLQLAMSAALAPVIARVIGRAKRMFDLACQPDEVQAALGSLAAAHPGLRVPGAFDGFEIAARAVLGQQVSVAAARTLAGRLAGTFGAPVGTPWPTLAHAFPSAQQVAVLEPAAIAGLGVTAARARSIVALARACASGALVLEPGAPLAATLDALRELPGIGAWTAQYLAMRALGWPDAFPAADLGVRRALQVARPAQAEAAASAWRPWRAYAVMHFWQSEHEQEIRR